jgi:DinB superfamily
MEMHMHIRDRDIAELERAFEVNEQDARVVVSGLSGRQGGWRAEPGSWSVAECLDHLATANRVYLAAMLPAAERALAEGRSRRGPALPGLIGGWFVRSFEPPVKTFFKMKAPRKIRPRTSPPLDSAMEQFLASQREVVTFLRRFAAIDLAGVVFPNPFISGVRFSLATGLHVLAAHERRHLLQAWQVRRAAEQSDGVTGGLND